MQGIVPDGHARRATLRLASLLSVSLLLASLMPAGAEPPAEDRDPSPPHRGQLSRVKHIIVVMQENHSFDNYFGVLAYAMGSPYRRRAGDALEPPCRHR